jgi:hypothetical protein
VSKPKQHATLTELLRDVEARADRPCTCDEDDDRSPLCPSCRAAETLNDVGAQLRAYYKEMNR